MTGSGKGLLTSDTCTPGTAVMYVGGTMAANVMAAQSVRLWFEYNFAEAQLRVSEEEEEEDMFRVQSESFTLCSCGKTCPSRGVL